MSIVVIKKILIVVAVLLLIGGVTVFSCYKSGILFNNSSEKQEQEEKPMLEVNQGEYVPPNIGNASSVGIAIPGWKNITMPAGEKEVAVDFPNPIANAGKYYLTFEISLKDTGEVLYTSGMVSPGLHIQRITLARALDVGTYDLVIHVQPYKMDDALTKTNNADIETKLIVV